MQNLSTLFGDGLHLFGLTWRALSQFPKSTRAAKMNLKRQFEPKFHWLSSQQDPVKIQLEMIG
jgi:hypothetical protein